MATVDRIAGTLLGTALGDALGLAAEGMSARDRPPVWPRRAIPLDRLVGLRL